MTLRIPPAEMEFRMVMNPTTDSVPGTRRYDAYGSCDRDPSGARTGYAGEVGEADLPWYLLGNRFYIPSLRQFVSPDSASPFDAGGLNRYAYCGGDPINRIDPTGESFWDYLGAALGIVGAAIGVAATGGALLGVLGAAAAGSLTASLSTTTMVAMTAATVLETVSIVAEVGSIASLAAGDQRASGIFGWVAFGAGVASAGTSLLGKAAAKRGLRSAQSSLPYSGRATAGQPAPIRHVNGHGQSSREVVHYVGGHNIPERTDNPWGLAPVWSEVTLPELPSRNFVNHMMVDDLAVYGMVELLAKQNSGRRIILATGVHGTASGKNSLKGGARAGGAQFTFNEANDIAADISIRYPNVPKIDVIDIASYDKVQFRALQDLDADIVYGFCYSAADQKFMKRMRVYSVDVYSRV